MPSLKAPPESSADHPWEIGGADGEGAECLSEHRSGRPAATGVWLKGGVTWTAPSQDWGSQDKSLGCQRPGTAVPPARLNSRGHGSPLNGWRSSLCGALGPSGSGGSRRQLACRLGRGDKAEPLVLETRAPPLPAPVPVWSRWELCWPVRRKSLSLSQALLRVFFFSANSSTWAVFGVSSPWARTAVTQRCPHM